MMNAPSDHMSEIIRQIRATGPGDATGRVSRIACSMVQLSYFSYNLRPVETIPGDVEDARKVFPPGMDMHWRCTWGPVLDELGGNLVFVAGLFAGSSQQPSPSPFLAAVVTRGTDVEAGLLGDLQQLYQDATPCPQWNPSWNSKTDQWIANGTVSALASVQGLTSGGQSLLGYLGSLPAVDGWEPLVYVTGHSLGACISSVVAPWLAAALPPSNRRLIVPIAFAAPTAGNPAFAADFAAKFPFRQFFYNPLDCIPKAWGDLSALEGIYGSDYPTPWAVDAWVSATSWGLNTSECFYGQISGGDAPPLAGKTIDVSADLPDEAFFLELLAQHGCANYMLLMGLKAPYAYDPQGSLSQRLAPSQAAEHEALDAAPSP